MSNYNEHGFYELHPTGRPNGAGRRPPNARINGRVSISSALVSNLSPKDNHQIGTHVMIPSSEVVKRDHSSRVLMISPDEMNTWRPAMPIHSWVNKAWNHASFRLPEKSDLMQTLYQEGHLVAMIIYFSITIKDQGRIVRQVYRIEDDDQCYLAVTSQKQLVKYFNMMYDGVKNAQRTYVDGNKLKKNQYLYQTAKAIYFFDDHSYDTEIGGFMEIARRFGKFDEAGQFILN